MKKEIKLTQEAFLDGYGGAFLRYINDDGTESVHGLSNNWYMARATGSDDNNPDYEDEYLVYWRILDGFDISAGDETLACDWGNPYMVLHMGKDVKDSVSIAPEETRPELICRLMAQTGKSQATIYNFAKKLGHMPSVQELLNGAKAGRPKKY